jgi:hypothetical protein
MRLFLIAALALTASASWAAPRPFIEIAAGLPEAVDVRLGAQAGPFGAALGTGLPVLAWSRVFRNDSITPTAWNPSLTLYAHFGPGAWRFGPEAQVLYFYGVNDEYAAARAGPINPLWARWRLDGIYWKQSLAARRSFGSWYAQAAAGWSEWRLFDVRTAGEGDVTPFRHPWESAPAACFSFGRLF